MKTFSSLVGILVFSCVMSGCSTIPAVPVGPKVSVLPGTGKNITEFQQSDEVCRDYAMRIIGQKPVDQKAGGDAGTAGSVKNTSNPRLYGNEAQYYYDEAYVQCMYASGHQVPVPAEYANSMVQSPAKTVPGGQGKAVPAPPPFDPPSSPPPDYVEPKK